MKRETPHLMPESWTFSAFAVRLVPSEPVSVTTDALVKPPPDAMTVL